jgi:hypothetical protein
MADPTDFVTAAQEQFLEALRQSQEATTNALRRWAESVQRFHRGTSDWDSPGAPANGDDQ